jgi:general secretion pathway protein F
MTDTASQHLAASTFKVRAHAADRGFISLERAASSADALEAELISEGLTPVSIEPVQGAQTGQSRRGHRFPLLIFCQQLFSLLEAGLQLVEAIDTLVEKEADASHRSVLVGVQTQLRSGQAFSQALSFFPQAFPALFLAAIEASEQTGGIQDALRRFIGYETRFQSLRSRLIGAMIYPVMLLSSGILVIGFLLGYVVPRFSQVFVDRLESMPFMSALVIRLGLSISDHPLMALAVLFIFSFMVGLLVVTAQGRAILVGLITRIPWMGEKIKSYELIRIYRSMSMLLRGGVPVLQSITMITGVASAVMRPGIQKALELVREGQNLSHALAVNGLTTVVSDRLLAVGDRSGQMGEMLERAADFLDAELERTVDRAVRMLEPLMMVVIGCLIGAIVILMYLPIFELADSVQ